MPPAAKYRHQLQFQVKSEPQDTFGDTPDLWVNETFGENGKVWGAYEPAGSKEFPVALKRHEETTARFRIRYRPGIHADTHRILFQDRTWNITEPILMPEGRAIELHIESNEIV